MNRAGDRVESSVAGAYAAYDRQLRVRHSKIGCILSLVLVPAGSSLDYFVYPDLLGRLFAIRVACDVATGLVFALHFTELGRRNIERLGLVWALLPQAAISWMIFISEGAMSPYYAGLNLVVIAMVVPLLWTFREALIIAGSTLGLYLAACLLHGGSAVESRILFNNLYFLLLTNLICATFSYFDRQRRFEELRLRHEVDLRNRELAQSYERLADLDRLKSEFFANLSHELRTPLTLIISPLDDLLRVPGALPPAARQSLEITRKNSLRLLRLINDLLELVRLEERRVEIQLEPVNLATFVPGMVESIRHLAQVKGLAVASQGPAHELIVGGDPERLEKIFLNLLTNAVKFTPPGGSIRARWRGEGETAVVEIEDTGIGISAKDLPYVFDRFRQADGSSTRRFHGLGIGLALAKELVAEHRGRLTVKSEVDSGTTFRVELPILVILPVVAGDALPAAVLAGPRREEREASEHDPLLEMARAADRTTDLETLAAPEGPGSNGANETLRFTILVVEDEPDMRRFLSAALGPEYLVIEAADGDTGLAMARTEAPNLLLLDLMLPGVDGLDICKRLKEDERTRGIKIVLLTARADERSKIAALEGGCDDFIVKPFNTLEVKTRIANLLRASKLEADLAARNVALEETLARLQATEGQLIQSEKMNAIGTLAAGILHEVNNPLNFTLTALEVARMRIPEARADLLEILDDIGEGMTRIRDIVSDLRAFTRPADAATRERFPLRDAAKAALHLVAHETSGVAVRLELAEGTLVEGSRMQITHLLMNLVANAARASREIAGERSPEIRLSSICRDERLEVHVRDNGVGINEAVLSKVFDPFFTTQEVGAGMGLGLSICHTIVRNHGGTIAIHSQEGQWTEVTFDLPSIERPTADMRHEQ